MEEIKKFKISNSALNKLEEMSKDNNKLILFIKRTGCYGYSFVIENLDKKIDLDYKNMIIYNLNNISLYILKKDINIINNTKLDYIKYDFGYKFVFNNINFKNTCGCGKSFSM